MKLNNDCKFLEQRLEPEPGTLYIVGTPIGNLNDLSPRAKRILKNVSLIACEDTRRSGQLLKVIESKVAMISYHKHNLKSRLNQILEILKENQSVALISDAGMPAISDPGQELVIAAKENKHQIICIPGPCAAITALAISGLESQRFCYEGFLPRKKSTRKKRLIDISKEERTTIIYESPHQLINLLKELSIYCGNERPIQISRELTKRYEESIGSTIEEVIEYFQDNLPKGEFTIVLGGNSQNKNKISESEALDKVKVLVNNGQRSKDAAQKISQETGYSKKWLYSKLHSKVE
tara:strand:- start:1450 stop:2331 length:882 start_codon:yes stop_codon:yes gene_type:complete